MFKPILNQYFANLGVALSKSFVRYTSGAISACSFSTHEIARHVSKDTGKDFNTSEKGLNYLLSNDIFQIDDTYWRMHMRMIFDLMLEQNLIKREKKIYIQVDFTSHENHFLILSASIILNNRAVPLYFTMRNYPKRKNQYDHKKMESAFLKGLKHVLSKRFQYVIVADRGFGNGRFLQLCEDNGFDYLVRLKPNLKIKHEKNAGLMRDLCPEDSKYRVSVLCWGKNMDIYKCSNEGGSWYLASNINGISSEEACCLYKDRFKIEKCFQDLKSSGFDMEKSKIRKYSRYKKLLAMTMVSHALLVLLGHMIVTKLPSLLKNSAYMANVILAYFLLEEKLTPYLQKNKFPGSLKL